MLKVWKPQCFLCSSFLASERMKIMKLKNMCLAKKKKKVRWYVTRLRTFSLKCDFIKTWTCSYFALEHPHQVHVSLPRSSHNWSNLRRAMCSGNGQTGLWFLLLLLLLNCMNCLYILEIKPLLVALFIKIFSHFVGCLFVVLWFRLLCKSFKVWLGPICLFLFIFLLPWGTDLRKKAVIFMSENVLSMIFSGFMVSYLCLSF